MIHRPERARARRGGPGVVLFHGFTGDRMESHWLFVKCSRALALAGIASLRFDFYGSGESEGEFSEDVARRSEEHTSELQSPCNLVCRLLLEKKKRMKKTDSI